MASLEGKLFIGVPSLSCAPERRAFNEAGLKERFGKIEVCGVPVHYNVQDLDPDGGLTGCTRNHVACMRRALEAGCTACLIVEDDVRPNRHFTEAVVRESVELVEDFWDIVRLHRTGMCKAHARLDDNEGFYHVSQLSGECYVIGKRLMELLVAAPV